MNRQQWASNGINILKLTAKQTISPYDAKFCNEGLGGICNKPTHTETDDWVRGICLRTIPSNVEVTRDAAPCIKTAFYTHLLSKMYMKIPKLYLATATAQQLGKVVGSGSGWRSLQRLIFFLSTFLSMPDELHRVLPSSLPAPCCCCCCCCCCCVKVGPVAPHLRSREQNSWAQPWAVTLLELHPVRSPRSGPGTRGPTEYYWPPQSR